MLAVGAALCFGMFSICVEVEYREGANTGGAIILRAIGTLPMAFVFWRRGGVRQLQQVPSPGLVVLVALQVITGVAYIVALDRMSIPNVVTVVYLYPVLTFVGALVLGWVSVSVLSVSAILLASMGVSLAVGGPSGELNAVGLTLAMSSSIAYAAALIVAQRTVATRDPLLVAAAVGLTSAVVQAVASVLLGAPQLPASAEAWVAGLCTGVVSGAAAYLLLYAAVARVGASVTSVVCCLEMVVALLGAGLLLGEHVSVQTCVGAGFILAAVALAGVAPRQIVPPP